MPLAIKKNIAQVFKDQMNSQLWTKLRIMKFMSKQIFYIKSKANKSYINFMAQYTHYTNRKAGYMFYIIFKAG